ncbi:MAG: hypothetical protein AAF651_03740 [Cyanobacteria bacterium P01_C01_bin.73]
MQFYRHSPFFRLLGVGLKIYVFTALLLSVVTLTMMVFWSPTKGTEFLFDIVPFMTKVGVTLGLSIAIAIALESLAQ